MQRRQKEDSETEGKEEECCEKLQNSSVLPVHAECQINLVKKWYSTTSVNIGTTSTCAFVHFAVHVLSSINYYCLIVLGD